MMRRDPGDRQLTFLISRSLGASKRSLFTQLIH
jgi:hypothetical protein